jgi:hypothetical protein
MRSGQNALPAYRGTKAYSCVRFGRTRYLLEAAIVVGRSDLNHRGSCPERSERGFVTDRPAECRCFEVRWINDVRHCDTGQLCREVLCLTGSLEHSKQGCCLHQIRELLVAVQAGTCLTRRHLIGVEHTEHLRTPESSDEHTAVEVICEEVHQRTPG